MPEMDEIMYKHKQNLQHGKELEAFEQSRHGQKPARQAHDPRSRLFALL
jgi:hypothetical protein